MCILSPYRQPNSIFDILEFKDNSSLEWKFWNCCNKVSLVKMIENKLQSVPIILGICALYSCCKNWFSKYWAIAPRRDRRLGSWEPLVTAFSSTDQYVILFYVCILFKETIFNLYCLFIDIELMANSSITHAWFKPI